MGSDSIDSQNLPTQQLGESIESDPIDLSVPIVIVFRASHIFLWDGSDPAPFLFRQAPAAMFHPGLQFLFQPDEVREQGVLGQVMQFFIDILVNQWH